MTGNPDDAHGREYRIRERAYCLWEEEGCPHGRDREYWQRAEAEMQAGEAAPKAADAPQPATARKKPGGKAKTKSEAPRKTAATSGSRKSQRGKSGPST